MSIFKFKQFEVDQSGCAMKINTDGVLIGALATHPDPKLGLDIGAGTGVIAMMLAQRYPRLHVHAVEIDKEASETAGKNFANAKFSNRLNVEHIAIQEYNPDQKYDLIVSNPPFFVNDLKSTEARKGIARHAGEQFFQQLISKTNELLAHNGKLWLILPVKQASEVITLAEAQHFKHIESVNLHSDAQKPIFRQIICLSKENLPLQETDLNIYDSLKVHSADYKRLLKDFFLAF